MENFDEFKDMFDKLEKTDKQETLKKLSFDNNFTLFTNLNDLIHSKKEFVIPDYQRGYVWEAREISDVPKKNPPKKQLDVFWDDLMRLYDEICAPKNDEEKNTTYQHYMGMLTFKTTDGKNNQYEIVDGQQRLTTFAILLSVLDNDLQIGNTEQLNLTYNAQNTAMWQALTNVLEKEINDKNSDIPLDSVYKQNLWQAKRFFNGKLKDFDKAQKDKNTLREIILNNLTFNILFNDDSIQASVIFETINNRGKGLTKLEILKNRIFFLLKRINGTTSNTSKIYNSILEYWKTIFENLGVAQASMDAKKDTINDDNFLQAWGFLEFDGLNIKEKYQAEAILEKFSLSNENDKDRKWTEQKLLRVMERMANFSDHWKKLFNPSQCNTLNSELKSINERLCHIGLDKWEMSCIVGLCCCLNTDYTDDLVIFLNFFEKYLFCHTYMYIGQSKDTSFLVGPVKDLYKIKIERDNKTYKGNFDDEVHRTLIDLAEKICGKQGSEKKDCLANIISTINLNKWADKLASSGFYNWNGISYFLFDKPNTPGAKEITWHQIADKKATIEHIFPQKPNADWDGLFDSADCDIEMAKQALGNLLPLSFKTNEKVKNKNIHFKKRIYEQDSASAMNFCKWYDIWDLNNLIYRTNEQLKVIYDHWLNSDVILKDLKSKIGGTYAVTYTQNDFDKCKETIIAAILAKKSKVKWNPSSTHAFKDLNPTLRGKQKSLIASLYRDNCKSYGSRIKNGDNILIVIQTQDELNKLLAKPTVLTKDEQNKEKIKKNEERINYNSKAEDIANNKLGLNDYKKRTFVLPSDLLKDEKLCLDVVKLLLEDWLKGCQPAEIKVWAEEYLKIGNRLTNELNKKHLNS